MSVKSAPYWWAECDNCGERCEYGGEHSAWSDFSAAIDRAVSDHGWSVSSDGKHHCADCPPFCICCGESAGDLAGERDYHCKRCWAAMDADVTAITGDEAAATAAAIEIAEGLRDAVETNARLAGRTS